VVEPSADAQRLHQLFAGLERAHGYYSVDGKPNEKGKIEGTRYTVKEPVTDEKWQRHLDGIYNTFPYGLGIVPVRDDGTVMFGAIDIDVYKGLDLKKLAQRSKEFGLPLIVCRTKSGGAHLYLFLSEPAPAALVRAKLAAWAEALDHKGVEIFPKQDSPGDSEDKRYGNWINIPYQAGEKTTRFAVKDGKRLTLADFFDYVDAMKVSPEELEGIDPIIQGEDDDLFWGAPPCLKALVARGPIVDFRNNFMFSIAVYLKRRYGPDAVVEKARLYNSLFCSPPLDGTELDQLALSATKKSYSYKCKDNPILPVCDKKVCCTVEFGVGGERGADSTELQFGKLQKLLTDPPLYIWEINEARVELSASDLLTQRAFQVRAFEATDKIMPPLKPKVWREYLEAAVSAMTTIEVPDDATRSGLVWVHLHQWCTSRVTARSKDELLLGKPWTEEGRTFFSPLGFLSHLSSHKVACGERDLYRFLLERGVQSHTETIKGKRISFWSIPEFTLQVEPFEVPRVEPEGQM